MKKIIFSIILILLLALLVSCTVDLSKKEPYLRAIGKQFVLQQDFYIYYFNNYGKYSYISSPCKFRIGIITSKDTDFYKLPNTVEEQYVGSRNSHVTLEGVLHRGTIVTLKRIVEQKILDNVYYYYLISPDQGPFSGQEINPSDIILYLSNPPYSRTWSDPPIFNSEYALPLPSDGIWWK